MPEFETLQLAIEGSGLATLTVNRPEKLNALDAQVLGELGEAVAHLGALPEVSVVVLTGAGGKAFVAGADIASMLGMTVLEGRAFSELGHRTLAALEALPKVVVAAVDGFALGGGLELAMACDFVYATERSRFGQPEVGLGVIPGFGGTQRLPRLVGPAKARELVYTGEMIGADEALRIGLVAAVYPVDGFLDKVRERGRLIASKGTLAVFQAKRVIAAGMDLPLERANELEQQAFGVLFGTEDRAEGMAAFLEKRKAQFRSR